MHYIDLSKLIPMLLYNTTLPSDVPVRTENLPKCSALVAKENYKPSPQRNPAAPRAYPRSIAVASARL